MDFSVSVPSTVISRSKPLIVSVPRLRTVTFPDSELSVIMKYSGVSAETKRTVAGRVCASLHESFGDRVCRYARHPPSRSLLLYHERFLAWPVKGKMNFASPVLPVGVTHIEPLVRILLWILECHFVPAFGKGLGFNECFRDVRAVGGLRGSRR